MWPCYGVRITVCMALLVFVLCQPEHSLRHPYMGQISLRNIFMGACFCSFFACSAYIAAALQHRYVPVVYSTQSIKSIIIIGPVQHPQYNFCVIAWADTCSIKRVSSMVVHCFEIVERCSMQTTVRFKLSTNLPFLGNIFTINSCFNCVTPCIKVLGWMKMVWISTGSGRPPQNSVLTLLVLYCRLGQHI